MKKTMNSGSKRCRLYPWKWLLAPELLTFNNCVPDFIKLISNSIKSLNLSILPIFDQIDS
jgi:hypothetical protein